MRKILTAREVAQLLKSGGPAAIPADVVLTPSGRDLIADYHRENGSAPGSKPLSPRNNGEDSSSSSSDYATARSSAPAAPSVPDAEFKWTTGADPKTPAEIEAFFKSPRIEDLKRRMCDIGRRIWEKDYVDGNGGNITVRVGDNLVLCTPTLISKGFMTPADMCLIDLDGNQLAGTRKRTSEAMTHLGIIKRQPKAKACVHAHPPHATAFAVAAVRPPTCMIPEAEVFLGEIGYAPYQTPGTPENANTVGEIGIDHQCVIMENHGVICWGKDVEDAYWKMENVDAYCKTVWIASQLGNGLKTFGSEKLRDLIAIRQKLGMNDARAGLRECELCDNAEFRPGVVCQVPARDSDSSNDGRNGNGSEGSFDSEIEAVVQQVTDAIMERMAKKE